MKNGGWSEERRIVAEIKKKISPKKWQLEGGQSSFPSYIEQSISRTSRKISPAFRNRKKATTKKKNKQKHTDSKYNQTQTN